MSGTRGRAWAFGILGMVLILTLGNLPVRAAELGDLSSVEKFKERFDRDAGKPRLLLLLSPT